MSSCFETEESLVCEALVREIALAKRWSAVIEAWDALLKVRRMAKDLKSECLHRGCPAPVAEAGGQPTTAQACKPEEPASTH